MSYHDIPNKLGASAPCHKIKGGAIRNQIIDKKYKPMPVQQQGEGFFGDLWDGVKNVGKKALDFAKNTKLISAGLSAFPETKAFAPAVSAIGLGKKKKTKRKSKSGGKTGGRKRKARK